MKKYTVILMIFLVILAAASASADSEVTAVPGITYMCGDSFEVTIQDQPITASQFSRASHALAEAGIGERLVEIRLIFRNLTPTVYNGFTPDSFSLTGHVRDRSISYTPVILQSYDTSYGSSGTSVSSVGGLIMPPLRQEDILLVYRVNPILINWELHFKPEASGKPALEYDGVTYEPMELQPCEGIFRFASIRNAETGEITYYNR